MCREAGARVATNVFVHDLDLGEFNGLDGRRLEVIADGLPLWRGAQLAIDTTLVSPLHSDGTAIRRAAAHDGAALEAARRRKERVYPELSGGGGRARLVVLAAEVGGTVVIRDSRVPERVGQGTGGVNALPHAEQGPSCLVPTLECHVGVQCSKGVLHVPPSNSGLRWGQVQFHLCKRCCVRIGLRERALSSQLCEDLRLIYHSLSEEDQGCRSRRLPPCAGVEGVPEEQNGRTQDEIVDVEVISRIDEG